jgi:high affinity sulfate transporter 1
MRSRDFVAGLSVAGLMLPEAVAYAGIAGLPPQRALGAAVVGCLVYALFGRSRFAVVAPTSSSAAVLAATLATFPDAPDLRAGLATVAVALAGLVFVAARFARLGLLTGFISRPVLRGLAFGLAVTIILRQLPAITGLSIHAPDLPHFVFDFVAGVGQWHALDATIGAVALIVLFTLKRWTRVPGAFLVVLGGAGLSLAFDLPGHGVGVVGSIALSPSWPTWPDVSWEMVSRLAQLTMPLVLVLFAESWGTMRTLALRHGDEITPDRELGAMGAANLASALVQGMPIGAGFSAGAANEAAGATSRWAAVVGGFGLAALVSVAAPLFAHLPQPILAAVVISALAHALDPTPLLRLWRLDRDQWVAIGAAVGVLLLGVVDGLILAIVFSISALLQRMAMPQIARLGRLPDSRDYVDVERHAEAIAPEGIGIWRPSEPLFFANAERIMGAIARAASADASVKVVVLSLEETFDIDSTALEALMEGDERLASRGRTLRLARARDPLRDLLRAAGADDLVARASYSVDDAVSMAAASLDGRGKGLGEAGISADGLDGQSPGTPSGQ